MASVSSVRRADKSGAKQEQAPKSGAQEQGKDKDKKAQRRATALPGYLQRRLAVGSASDPAEVEADKVADRVVSRKEADKPTARPEQKDAKKAQRKEVDVGHKLEQAKKRDADELKQREGGRGGGGGATPTAGAPAPEPQEAQRKPKEERPPTIARRAVGHEGGKVDADTEQRLSRSAGSGARLPADLSSSMSREMGHDFSGVHVHHDPEAARLASDLGAQAFTVGRDVYFGQGHYQPETASGQHLIAHELTHVVQQSGSDGAIHRAIDPATDTRYTESARSTAPREALETLQLPGVKARHMPIYAGRAGAGTLKRKRGYDRAGVRQRDDWNRAVQVDETALESRLRERSLPVPAAPRDRVSFAVGSRKISRSKAELLNLLKIPDWDRHGQRRDFQVDHIIELQVSGEDGNGTGNSLENMELLDQPSNSSSGRTIMASIYEGVDRYLETLNPPPNRRQWLRDHDIGFTQVHVNRGAGSADTASAWWSLTDIRNAEPMRSAATIPPTRDGTAAEFVLLSAPGGIEVGRFHHAERALSFAPGGPAQAARLAGLVINRFNLTESGGAAAANAAIGTIDARWDMPRKWQPTNPSVQLPLASGGAYSAYVSSFPAVDVTFEHLSPVSFPELTMRDGELYAQAPLTPSLPIFNTPINVTLQGKDITFSVDYGAQDVRLPFPGVTIDEASISAFYSTQRGFGLGGEIAFAINNVGDGRLTASFTQAGGVAFHGSFDFDKTFFDQARVTVGYARGIWSATGTLAVTTPNKIRGLRAASLTASMEGSDWSLVGTADPMIPGVERATVGVSRTEAGITFDGNIALAASTAVRSGNIHVVVAKREGVWSVAGDGTVVPNIPSLDATATISYANGIFTAQTDIGYNRGRLSGTITVGVTNAPLGEDGRPAGEPPEGPTTLRVFGGGSLTIQVGFLQGTAGIQLLPNGEIEVHGRLAVANPITLLEARRWDRTLISIGLDIPIFGVAVAGQRIGIFCTIGGDLKLVAGIGPAQITDVAVDVIYNPAHEEDATVTGTARFHMPADAGLSLGVHAAIGAGIPVVSAQAGIEITGKLGVEAALDLPLTVNWSPRQGLAIDAPISVTMQPMFKFDVNGYVLVEADLWIHTFELYRHDWNLASMTLGSGYQVGMTMPFHYQEGEPFNPSLDDIQVTYPSIEPMAVLSGLFDRIT